MKTLLLTGATGFVGFNMLAREAQHGTRILAPVRSAEKLRRRLECEGLSHADIDPLDTDPSKWGDLRPTHALLSAGVLFARTRGDYHSVNVDWNLRVLDVLPSDCRVVVLSSQAAGGPTPADLQARRETDADAPLTMYGQSKLELERAIRRLHPERAITILRPPMVLGSGDSATLQLFKMAAGPIRPKPGLRKKEYSFIDVRDLLDAIQISWQSDQVGPYYVASDRSITDLELIRSAALSCNATGLTVPMPQIFIKCLSWIVDSHPKLRAAAPSLTRDRALDLWVDRWVVDSSSFRETTRWESKHTLEHSVQSACDFYVRTGQLKIKCKKPS
jgi:nucleoside-diphosphate-sugar epimerase